jgi:hypothetical protein
MTTLSVVACVTDGDEFNTSHIIDTLEP